MSELADWYSDAVDEITRLRAEVKRLTEENEIVRARLGKWYALFFQQQNDSVRIAKKRDRYREALERLARLGNGDKPGNSEGNQIAIRALLDPNNASQ